MLKLNVFIQPRFVLHSSGASPTHLSSILVAGDSVREKIMAKQFCTFPCHFHPIITSIRSCLVWSFFSKTHPGEDSQVLLGELGEQYKKPHNSFDPPPPVLILRTEALGCLPKQDAFSQPDMPGSYTGIQGKCNSSLKAGPFQALICI